MSAEQAAVRIRFCILLISTGALFHRSPPPGLSNSAGGGRKGQHGIFVMKADRTGGKLPCPDMRASTAAFLHGVPDGKMITISFPYRPADNEIGRKFRIPSHYPLYVMTPGATIRGDCSISPSASSG